MKLYTLYMEVVTSNGSCHFKISIVGQRHYKKRAIITSKHLHNVCWSCHNLKCIGSTLKRPPIHVHKLGEFPGKLHMMTSLVHVTIPSYMEYIIYIPMGINSAKLECVYKCT